VLARVAVPDHDSQQQAGVELLAAGEAHVAPKSLRPAIALDELPDRRCLGPPRRSAAGRDEPRVSKLGGPIKRQPAHHLGLREVRRSAAALPDSRIGLPPDSTDKVGCLREPTSCVCIETAPGSLIEPRRLHIVAVDVELALVERLVADPHRSRVPIPGQKSGTISASSSTRGPKMSTSRPSGPASNDRVVPGLTRTASSCARSTSSSSSLTCPEPASTTYTSSA